MLLGQLFFYSKELDKLLESGDIQLLKNTQILGIDSDYLKKPDLLAKNDVLKILVDFIETYQVILKKESLQPSYNFWSTLVDPLKKDADLSKIKSDYLKQLYNWIETGSKLKELPELLSNGVLTTTEGEYSLYYGLNVVYTLNSLISSNSIDSIADLVNSFANDVQTHSFSETPQVIVISSLNNNPLFKNINFFCLNTQDANHQSIAQQIKNITFQTPSISIILIDESYISNSKDLEKQIKKVPELKNIFLISLKLSSFSNDNFFDEIVTSTLGVRLV